MTRNLLAICCKRSLDLLWRFLGACFSHLMLGGGFHDGLDALGLTKWNSKKSNTHNHVLKHVREKNKSHKNQPLKLTTKIDNRVMVLILWLLSPIGITACGHKPHSKDQVITVRSHSLTSSLYYPGIIQPLKSVTLTAPVEGTVSGMMFHYGDIVANNQLLFTISSDKFEEDYKTAFMAYIKAKTDFTNHQMQLRESDFLHKNKLISEDDFKSKQTNFFNAQLALIQAKESLAVYLNKMNVKGLDVFALSIEDIDKINQVLQAQNGWQLLQVRSPARGVVLLPTKEEGMENAVKKIMKGAPVKQGEVLAIIGDVSGLSIAINVNELNVNQLKIGQKVKVTGVAFPEFELQGEIAGIDRQAQVTQGGTPVFPVEIRVPVLTESQQKKIHIGMSAKIEIQLEGPEVLTVPLRAVMDKNGSSYVRMVSHGEIREVFVNTGQTTQNDVVITSPLKPGDQVVITD